METKFTIQLNDITRLASDLLLLKHARGFHGGDLLVANLLTKAGLCTLDEISPKLDNFTIVQTNGTIAPASVMFIGTPNLGMFTYGQMHRFAARAIGILAEKNIALDLMTTTIHGVNYGLDASESLQSLVRGFQEGLARHPNVRIKEIAFVERHERTARILRTALESVGSSVIRPEPRPAPASKPDDAAPGPKPLVAVRREEVAPRPTAEPVKKHVFVAMPFSEEFQDIYEFGIYEPIRRCGYICERVDEPSFTGDILQRIITRLSTAEFVIAELTGARANVYLEVGYAWGKGVPVITVAREGEKLHFDVSTHRCIFYRTIGQLAKELEKLVRGVYCCEGGKS